MIDALSLLLILVTLPILISLAVIDLRTYLLPNVLTAPFALSGIAFHLLTYFKFIPLEFVIYGGLAGFFSLFIIRAIANHMYQQDTLGLGDVKLMGAAGIWLGLDGILFALTIGSLAGLFHGLFYGLYLKHGKKQDIRFSRLNIPAGPGFITGIIFVGIYIYQDFILQIIQGYMS